VLCAALRVVLCAAGASERLRIYLATDEPRVIEEAGRLYPQFVFLTTNNGGRASGEGERAGLTHTHNLLSDVFHLAKADFFVGTASSQVSRCSLHALNSLFRFKSCLLGQIGRTDRYP
jgi:glycoprotein 6-alpha-L-fucosyltransferase